MITQDIIVIRAAGEYFCATFSKLKFALPYIRLRDFFQYVCATILSGKKVFKKLFSSPGPLCSQGEVIVYPCPVVRRPSTILKILASETAWPKSQIFIESLYRKGKRKCIYIIKVT